MRVLILSDIHANISALDAVLESAGDVDAYWCLGDLVGYGPDPNEVIERVRNLPNLVCILGNHDAAVTGVIQLDAFNNEARRSVLWMQENLTQVNLDYLNSLEETFVTNNVTLTHGSPRNPIWEYILDAPIAKINMDYFETPVCFVGHTHLPVAYYTIDKSHSVQWRLMQADDAIQITGRAIINPGSVGQPRDRDPRAAYAIYDTEEIKWEAHRIMYDIEGVQKRILSTGLPSRNAQRLAEGW